MHKPDAKMPTIATKKGEHKNLLHAQQIIIFPIRRFLSHIPRCSPSDKSPVEDAHPTTTFNSRRWFRMNYSFPVLPNFSTTTLRVVIITAFPLPPRSASETVIDDGEANDGHQQACCRPCDKDGSQEKHTCGTKAPLQGPKMIYLMYCMHKGLLLHGNNVTFSRMGQHSVHIRILPAQLKIPPPQQHLQGVEV